VRKRRSFGNARRSREDGFCGSGRVHTFPSVFTNLVRRPAGQASADTAFGASNRADSETT
jgi:hypothetical protein